MFLVPDKVIVLKDMPLTASGKIDYQVLDTAWVRQAGDSLGVSGEPELLP